MMVKIPVVMNNLGSIVVTAAEQALFQQRFLNIRNTPTFIREKAKLEEENSRRVRLYIGKYEDQVILRDASQALERLKVDFDPKIIIAESRFHFYDPGVMRVIEDVYSSIAHPRSYNLESAPSPEFSINYWLKDFQQIGAESAYGKVFRPSFDAARPYEDGDGGQSPFVFKMPVKESTDMETELAVGLRMNSLRQKIPNFAYTYGGFRCTKVGELTDEAVCRPGKSQVRYIVVENIFPSVTLHDYVADTRTPVAGVFEKLIQILSAMQVALDDVKYTHYDLHTSNILIRKTDKAYQLKYTIKGDDFYIRSDAVATIIDYGRSTVTLEDGRAIGAASIYQFLTRDPFKPFPFHDVYRLLEGTALILNNRKYLTNIERDLGIELARILFEATVRITNNTVDDVDNSTVPDTPVRLGLTYSDFIQYLAQRSPLMYRNVVRYGTPWTDVPVAGCNPCRSVTTIATRMLERSAEAEEVPESVFRLYEEVMFNNYLSHNERLATYTVTQTLKDERLFFTSLSKEIRGLIKAADHQLGRLLDHHILIRTERISGGKKISRYSLTAVPVGGYKEVYEDALANFIAADGRLTYMAKTIAMASCVASIYGKKPEHVNLVDSMRHKYNKIISSNIFHLVHKVFHETIKVAMASGDLRKRFGEVGVHSRHSLPREFSC